MLECIRNWLIGITCAAMITALAESLTPSGAVRKIGRMTGGLMLLIAILQPVLALDTTALTRSLTQYKLDLSAYSTELEEQNAELMKGIIEEQSAAYISDKAAALDLSCQVFVEAEGEDGWPVPQTVTVVGALTEEQKKTLTRIIETDFAIPAARQYYESGEGT